MDYTVWKGTTRFFGEVLVEVQMNALTFPSVTELGSKGSEVQLRLLQGSGDGMETRISEVVLVMAIAVLPTNCFFFEC